MALVADALAGILAHLQRVCSVVELRYCKRGRGKMQPLAAVIQSERGADGLACKGDVLLRPLEWRVFAMDLMACHAGHGRSVGQSRGEDSPGTEGVDGRY